MGQKDTNMVEVINVSGERMRFTLDNLEYDLAPQETAMVHKNYAVPQQFKADRDAVAAAVDRLTNGKVLWRGDKRAKNVQPAVRS